MAEEQTVEEPQPEETRTEKPPEVQTEENADGTDFIDFEQLDPKVKARFDRIYRNMKENERALSTSAEVQRKLVDRLTNLEKSDINNKGQNAITYLNAQKVEALDEGDSAKVIDIDNKLRAVEQSQKYQPQPIEVPQPQVGGLSPEDESLMERWAGERDDGGTLRRPWADPGHPLHQKAASVGYAVMQDPELFTLGEQLSEIDRLMGSEDARPQRISPGVLPAGEGGRRTGKSRPGLTTDEKAIARAMYPEKGTGDAEKAYLQAKQNLGM